MLNVLYEKLPDYVTVHGIRYPIETDFREWIRFAELADDEEVQWNIKCNLMLRWYCKRIPEDLESAIYALGDFLAARNLYMQDDDDEQVEKIVHKPAFSFEDDAGCIYAAFIDCYGIDLQEVEYMHWWKFRTLFDGLPEDTEIKQRMMYRTIDANSIKDKNERNRVKKIQKEIALHKKRRCMGDYEIGDMFA